MIARSHIVLIACLAIPGLRTTGQTEPNDAVAQVTFLPGPEVLGWTAPGEGPYSQRLLRDDPGPIRPTHVAQVSLPRERPCGGEKEVLDLVMKSPMAQRLSRAQRDFLDAGFGVWVHNESRDTLNHYSIWLYAVSEEDAKTMVRALLDTFATNAKRTVAAYRRDLAEAKERLSQSQVVLAKKQERLKAIEKERGDANDPTYGFLNDDEAARVAKEIILQMDRETRTLDIDLAGVRGKLKVIDEVLAKPNQSTTVLDRLEALKTDQLIELTSIEARRQAIDRIRDAQQRFHSLVLEREGLTRSIAELTKALDQDRKGIENATALLEHPSTSSYQLPPPVYGNRVFIYPIRPNVVPETVANR